MLVHHEVCYLHSNLQHLARAYQDQVSCHHPPTEITTIAIDIIVFGTVLVAVAHTLDNIVVMGDTDVGCIGGIDAIGISDDMVEFDGRSVHFLHDASSSTAGQRS